MDPSSQPPYPLAHRRTDFAWILILSHRWRRSDIVREGLYGQTTFIEAL